MELILKAGRTPEETEALNWLKEQLSDLKKKEAYWQSELSAARVSGRTIENPSRRADMDETQLFYNRGNSNPASSLCF